MKKIMLLAAVAATFFFTACQKEETLNPEITGIVDAKNATATDLNGLTNVEAIVGIEGTIMPSAMGKLKKVAIADLPTAIADYLKANYAGVTIKSAFTDKEGNYILFVKDKDGNNKILSFDKEGTFIKESTPKTNNGGGASDTTKVILPAAATTYINTTYPNAVIGKPKQNKDGNYEVMIKTKEGKVVFLVFDKDGKVVKETVVAGGSNPKAIDSTALNLIKTYITKTYGSDVTIGKPTKNKDGNYEVSVKNKDGKKITLVFDAKGNFIKVKEGVVITDPTNVTLPTAAKDYITKTYPDAKVLITIKDKDGNYLVTVQSGNKIFILVFDKDGKFVKKQG